MEARQKLHSDQLGQPIGMYSHGFLAPAGGQDLYVAGQLSVDTAGEVVADGDFESQMRQVFANFGAVLAAASLSFDHVVKFTTYLISPDDIENFYEVRSRLFPDLFTQPDFPPNTLLVVQRLVRPEFRIEVEGVARETAASAVVIGRPGFVKVLPVRTSAGVLLGVLTGDRVTTVPSPDGSESPVLALLRGGQPAIETVRAQVSGADPALALPLAGVVSGPLIPAPEKVLCVGFNYRVHAEEMAAELPSEPNVFAKFGNCLIGQGEDILLPAVSGQIDYEGELAVVIGLDCRGVSEADALSYVGGYTILNDVSARDLQFQTSQWTLGKALDTFAPVGPVLTLAEEIADPQDLRLTTRLNGEVMQDASTGDMIFGVARIISAISQSMTLRPGDIIATGTPAGVGWKRTPARFLRDGDVIEVEISGIGALRNPVRAGAGPPLAARPGLSTTVA